MSINYNFNLTEQEADLVVKSLGELPFKITAGIISKLQKQFQEQSRENLKTEEKVKEKFEK